MSSIMPTTPFYMPHISDRQLDQVRQLQNKIGAGAVQKNISRIAPPSAEGKMQLDNGGVPDFETLDKVSREFESIFIHQMLKAMRKTVIQSDFLSSFAGDQYQSMMDEEIAKEVSKQKGLGLAEVIHRQLDKLTQHQLPRP